MINELLSLWQWSEIALCAMGGFVAQVPAAVLTFPFDKRRRLVGRIYRRAGVTAAQLSPYWKFRVIGEAPKDLQGKYVVVSNHESNADPFLISFLPWEMKWLAKQSLFKVPFLGWGMWLAGDIGVRRGKEGEAQRAIEVCGKWLEKGMPVMIFPEGTRSKDGTLGPFKDGAFRLAIEHQAKILPLAISGTHEALPKNSWKFRKSEAVVKVGEPISTDGMTLADVEQLKATTRDVILKLRDEVRAARG